MTKTCCYCDKHAWSDHQEFHICVRDGSKKEMDDTCELHRDLRRGSYGCLKHQDCFWDTDVVEGHVKDDKHTRGK